MSCIKRNNLRKHYYHTIEQSNWSQLSHSIIIIKQHVILRPNNTIKWYLCHIFKALEACQLGLKTMEDNHSNEFTKKAKFFARIGKINWLKGEL